MQILEIIILFFGLVLIGLNIYKKEIKKHYVIILAVSIGIVILFHSLYGNARWQHYPLYIAIFILCIMIYLKSRKDITTKTLIRRGVFVVALLLFFISGIAQMVLPVYDVPTPTGQHSIGTESFIIEDDTREEIYSEDDDDIRRIKIQTWYPAEKTEGYDKALWLEDGQALARGLSKDMGVPFFMFDHTADILSNSYSNAPISEDKETYPLIILSHGWRGFRNLHTDYAEELASLGYVVVAIDHTYGSVATVLDDEVIYVNKDALPQRETTPNFLDYANRLVSTYAADITTTIEYLEVMNANTSSRFNDKLDLSTIGLIGHSTGGGASVKVALNDSRIDFVIGLDAWVEPIEGDEMDIGLEVPSLFLRSEMWETGPNNVALYTLIENSEPMALLYQIDGTTHYDFAMTYMYSPLTKQIGFSGELDTEYLNDMLKTMITDFSYETLINERVEDIDIGSWEEVKEVTWE